MIIGRHVFNHLGAFISTLYLCMKYSFSNRWVGLIQGNQEISIKFYVESLKLKRIRAICISTMSMKIGMEPLEKASTGDIVSNSNEEIVKSTTRVP